MKDPNQPKSTCRWPRLTPDRFVVGLLTSETVLLLADRFAWFGLTRGSGWNAILAVTLVGLAALTGLLWLGLTLLLRRHFQFSMRSLCALMISVAIPCSWFVGKMQQAHKQREAVVAIHKLNGIVYYEYAFQAQNRGMPWEKITIRSLLRELLGEDFWSHVDAVDLGRFRRAHCPWPSDPPWVVDFVTSDDEAPTRTEVTNLALPHLCDLKHLKTLDLSGSRVNDAGVAHLATLARLEILCLEHSDITDVGMRHLTGLAHLEYVNVQGTAVTHGGVRKLQRALPKCLVVR